MPGETVDALGVDPHGVYCDCTAGGGGHDALILDRLAPDGRLILLDRDPDAIAHLSDRFGSDERIRIVRANFSSIKEVLAGAKLDGALMDLGVSSHQIDDPDRGFSYIHDGPLDMRMDRDGRSAADVVNEADKDELIRILRVYGEERCAPSIAAAIVRERQKAPLTNTAQLAGIVSSAIPAKMRRTGGNPCKRTFQALRIAVNDELDQLPSALESVFSCLKVGGTMCVITFHSLEDRIVKHYFASLRRGCVCDPRAPVCVCGQTPRAQALFNSKTPGEDELADNPRSASARLRAVKKLKD